MPQSLWCRIVGCGGPVSGTSLGLLRAELREQAPGAQDSRRDAAADVAHDNRFTKVKTEHVGWIDTRVDAVEDLESMWRGKREASERAACDEGGVRRKTLLASVSRLVGRQPERTTSSVALRRRLTIALRELRKPSGLRRDACCSSAASV